MIVDKDAILVRREALVRWMSGKRGSVQDLAKSIGVSAQVLYEDWSCRDRWLPAFLRLREVELLVLDEVAGWQSYVHENLEMARRYDKEGAKSAANTAMKNVREAKGVLSDLLQSMGCLPKVAIQYEVDQKLESVEVTVSGTDVDYLNKAAGILNKADGRQKRPENLH